MSFMSRTSFGFHPFQFSYPIRRLTMEEILYKFIDEERREHEEMGAFIREFKTTNKLLLKKRNNSLRELKFKVYWLSKAINNAQLSNSKVKGVTTRGGKTTTETIRDTNIINKEPPVLHHDKPVGPNKVLDETKPQEMKEQTVRLPILPIPFPHKLKNEKEEAQQRRFLENLKQLHINIPFTEALAQMPKYAKFLKGLLLNKTRLEEACTITMNERCSAVLLNKLPSKEKDIGSFTIPCDIGHLHINNALADLGASISLMPYTMYEKLGLGEPKPTRMSLELADRSIQYPRGIAENINLAARYLSSSKNPNIGELTKEEIVDEFPNEHLMILKAKFNDDEPWYADYVNYIVGKVVPPKWTPERKKTVLLSNEVLEILAHCHSSQTGGHHSASATRRKIYESGFYWPNIFKDAKDYVTKCDACQKSGNISSRSEMPQNNIQLRDGAYENTRIYKERTKKWHNSRLRGDKDFKIGDKVLLFNSRLRLHPRKLKSKWSGPLIVKTMYPYGAVEINDKNGSSFKVNGKRLKKYYDGRPCCKEIDELVTVYSGKRRVLNSYGHSDVTNEILAG
ncbi:retrovirus-related pol polyprotein from transposon TNT 1-94 [Tanacetum coccineum]